MAAVLSLVFPHRNHGLIAKKILVAAFLNDTLRLATCISLVTHINPIAIQHKPPLPESEFLPPFVALPWPCRLSAVRRAR